MYQLCLHVSSDDNFANRLVPGLVASLLDPSITLTIPLLVICTFFVKIPEHSITWPCSLISSEADCRSRGR